MAEKAKASDPPARDLARALLVQTQAMLLQGADATTTCTLLRRISFSLPQSPAHDCVVRENGVFHSATLASLAGAPAEATGGALAEAAKAAALDKKNSRMNVGLLLQKWAGRLGKGARPQAHRSRLLPCCQPWPIRTLHVATTTACRSCAMMRERSVQPHRS